MNDRVGILGGTFNPIHIGHLILAQNAVSLFGLSKVLVMPSGVSYLKDPNTIASTQHRINMTRLAIEDNPFFELSTIETDRSGNSYTYETLSYLKDSNPDTDYYYITGSDTILNIEKWRRPEEIFNKCTIVFAKRAGEEDKIISEKTNYLTDKFNAHIIPMDVPEIAISSTLIRNHLHNNYSIKYYVPDKVLSYIEENDLYVN